MFERHAEKARRVIFFARYEASQYGSRYIESEHILLALQREVGSDNPNLASLIFGFVSDGKLGDPLQRNRIVS
jgi:hypothetical protein